jgi:inner membrane protein
VDNLTHSLVGAALARAGLERRTPLATATLVLAANAPDIDVFSYARGPYFALAFRRGITHGIPALLVLPFVVAGLMLAWDLAVRRRRDPDAPRAAFGPLLLLSAIGVLTHPSLDWLNIYGMRWWLPFDGRWSYGDSLFIIDPWLWILLGAAVALGGSRSRGSALLWTALAAVTSFAVVGSGVVPTSAQVAWGLGVLAAIIAWISGRLHSETGRRRLAQALVVVAALYIGAMIATHRAAASDVRAQLEGGLQGEQSDVMISPLPARPLRSNVLIAGVGGYLRATMDWTEVPAFQLSLEDGLPHLYAEDGVSDADAVAAAAAARLHPDIASYLVWSRFPYWAVRRAGDGFDVTVGDARYTERGGGLSGLTVRVPGAR